MLDSTFWQNRVSFSKKQRLPIILQTEASECGLICLAMVSGYHGGNASIASIRQENLVSQKGMTLAQLIKVAKRWNLSTRAVKVDLENLEELNLPCVLHWNFNHFVVLKKADKNGILIHNPANGVKRISWSEASEQFTGVALELWPDEGFSPERVEPPIKLRSLLGRVTGLASSLSKIICVALALEIFGIVSPFFIQWVLDDVIISADLGLLGTLSIGFFLVMLLQQITMLARSWMLLHMNTMLGMQWRSNVFTHLINLPMQYFEKRHLGDIISRFGSTDQIQKTLTTAFSEAILDGVMAIATLIMMFIYSRVLFFVAIVAVSLYAFGRWVSYKPFRAATEEQIMASTKQYSHFLETLRGVKSIKLFQRENERQAAWLSLLGEQVNADIRMQKSQIFYKLLNGILFGMENILIIYIGASQVIGGEFSVGMLMAFNSYKGQFDSRISSLIDKYFELRLLEVQGERLSDIIFSSREKMDGEQSINFSEPIGIEFSNVSYRYSNSEPFVLDGLNFAIKAGESVAITGPSGCGKTTIVNLMLKIFDPVRGDIFFDDKPYNRIGAGGVRSVIGTVLQDDVLFAGSIFDNICFFDPDADRTWVKQCAQMADINEDIESMPMGYNTLVGDMGTTLSGGQKQRVLLARALYKKPKILILDEATSHLDVERENHVNKAIQRLSVTRIIVAHRPETIASADRVLIMGAGRIEKDIGRHGEKYA